MSAGAVEDAPKPRISCVIPVFNGARYLAESIESVLGQTYAPYEVIVVDDGSTDDTAAVVERCESRVCYVRQSNQGPAAARNRGIELAAGDLVAFQDADDLWLPEKLARQAARFAARPELDVSLVRFRNFWEEDLAEEALRFRDHALARDLPGYTAQAIVARRDLFARIGLLDREAPHKDIAEWLIRASGAGAVIEMVPETLVLRRIHRENRSRARGGVDGEELLALARAVLDRRRRKEAPQA